MVTVGRMVVVQVVPNGSAFAQYRYITKSTVLPFPFAYNGGIGTQDHTGTRVTVLTVYLHSRLVLLPYR
jgi:hypothetical protein